MTVTVDSPPAFGGEVVREFERPSAEVVARLARLPVANVSDALNKHGVLHHEVRPLAPGMRACGPALTCGSVDLTVKIFALRLAQPGDVFVLAAGGVNGPVVCAGIPVEPGDVVVAGEDGIVIVPREIAAEIAEAAERIEAGEAERRDAIRAGDSPPAIEDALQAAGY